MTREDSLTTFSPVFEQFLSQTSVLREVFDAIPLQIVVKSLRREDFGTFLLWNKVAEELLGIRAEEALGKTDAAFFPAEQAAFFAEKDWEVAMGRVPLVIEKEYIVSRNLGRRILSTIKTPLFNQQDEAVALMAVSQDITERIETEEDLKRSIDFLTQVNSQLPGAIFQFKVDPDGRPHYTYLSEGVLRITGDPPEAFERGEVNLLARIVAEDLPAFLGAMARSRRESTTCRHEFRIWTAEGEMKWTLSTASPTDLHDGSTIWHGFITDVTEHKRTLEALRRGDERLHHALEAMGAAVWELEVGTGALYLSPEWKESIDPACKELPASLETLVTAVHEEDAAVAEVIASLGTRPWTGQLEYRHRLSRGEYIWLQLSGKPIFDEDGILVRQVGAFLDISERKKMEHQLVEAKESAERASQAKGDFLAMMSHEIRTPLNAVLGFSELLAGTPLSTEQSGFLQTIQDSSGALLVVLNDILDYSKIESGKLDFTVVPTDVARVIRSSVDIFRPQAAARGVKLNAVFSGNIPQYLLCDAVRLSQIIHNLLSNAVKFTERGEIWVELSSDGLNRGNVWPIALKVRDTGIGIDLQEHPSLFDPFYQADSSTRRRRGGTGLGLAIVRRLVGLMNGQIEVESNPGEGTAFRISLPLFLPDHDEPISEADQKRVSMNLGSLLKRILIVEDNATNRRLLKLFLKKLGYDADEAENGFAGLEMAGRQEYDVIFMDLEMPGMDGYEAARNIRMLPAERLPYIVALTAHAMPEYRERAFQAGMQAYLSKPVKKDEIARLLREVFRR